MTKPPRFYVPLDVNFARDPHLRAAGPDAELLYLRGLAYAKGARTGGFIPTFDLEVVGVGLRNVRRSVARLEQAGTPGLWVPITGGWLIRGWDKWNPTTAAAELLVSRQSDHGRRGNHERWHVQRGISDPACPLCLAMASGQGR